MDVSSPILTYKYVKNILHVTEDLKVEAIGTFKKKTLSQNQKNCY